MRLLENTSLLSVPKDKTRGGLQPARIIQVKTDEGNKIAGQGDSVDCMFNPYEYSVSKSNTFKEQESVNSGNAPIAELEKIGAQTL